jgi:TolB-like protein/DNA-binding winged helix-turn-helix (wHTH) protein/Tfp pilus assembly protein PilF
MKQPGEGPASVDGPTRYRVGDLHVDLGRVRVSRGDVPIPLPRLSFDLLVALIRAAPLVATVDDLMNAVWPGLVVGPETLSQRVKLLREALGDDSRKPRYVAVVRSRGYQLVAAVEVISQEIQPADAAATPPAPRRGPARSVIAGTVLALLVVAVAGWLLARSGADRATPTAGPPDRSIAVLPFANVTEAAGDRPLAIGIAEAVLHKLTNLPGLAVIARTSSFAYEGRQVDVRQIGRELRVGYVLEGSVQRESGRLRVTAQLIDTRSGIHRWSLQFDEKPERVFAVQDEIALQVARALQLALDDAALARMHGEGTTRIEAYLAYLEGKARLATWRLADTQAAAEQFSQALRLDPGFPRAYVMLATARVRAAEYEVDAGRDERFDAAVADGLALLDKAIGLDPQLGPAYAERAYLRAFKDLAAAQRDYRRAIELTPSDAAALRGLAAVVWEDEASRPEALALLDRARALDPLDPALDVTKAVYLFFGPGRVEEAEGLLLGVLERDPDYVPALTRLGTIYAHHSGRVAKAVEVLEHALAVDPHAEQASRILVQAYVGLGELPAARSVIDQVGDSPARRLPLYVGKGDWLHAAQAARAAILSDTLDVSNEEYASQALRIEARRTRDYAGAMALVERLTSVSWGADGEPQLGRLRGTWSQAVALADLMQLAGDRERADRLLTAVLARIERDAAEGNQAVFWNTRAQSLAYALRGEDQAALVALAGMLPARVDRWQLYLDDPAFARLRAEEGFQALRASTLAARDRERAELRQMRADGRIPARDGGER